MHIPWFAEFDIPISSASVEDFDTIACFTDLRCTAPKSPVTMQLPVGDLIHLLLSREGWCCSLVYIAANKKTTIRVTHNLNSEGLPD